jgi:hypothetical protein
MTTNDRDLENRLRAGFNSGAPSTDDSLLSAESLEARSPRVRNPQRTRKIAAGSLLGVGSLAVVGVLVTTIVLPGQAPLFTLAEGGGGVGVESAMADSRMGWWVEYEYLAGEGLSSEGGRGEVYQLELEGTPEVLLSTVGNSLGVAGTPAESEYSSPEWPLYVLGAEDWTAPSITVTWSGTGNWYYNNPVAYPEPVCTEIPPSEDGTDPGSYNCVNPEPAGPLVSAEEAKAQAAELFRATGLSLSAEDVRVLSNDEWGVGVAASLEIDGVDTALEWTMFWAPGPVLASASGHAVTVRERGGYDTISPLEAVDRLASGVWWGAPSPSFYESLTTSGAQVRDAGVSTMTEEAPPEVLPEPGNPGEGTPGEEVPGEPGEGEEPAVEPEPLPEPLPEPVMPEEPEIISLTVTGAEATLLLVWDGNGNAWLVPGYVMRHGEDPWAWTTVISLMDGVLQMPEPMPITIMPAPEPYIEE